MKKLILFTGGALMAAQAAFATSGIFCTGTSEPDVSAFLAVGSVAGFGVFSAEFDTPDGAWSTQAEEEAQKIEMVQGASEGVLVIADFADANFEEIIISLRLIRVENDMGVVGAGVLSLPGGNAWPVQCDFG